MVKKNGDVCGGGCMKESKGKTVVEEEKIKEICRCHFEKLSNEKFPLGKVPRNFLGLSGVVAQMLKAAGKPVTEWMTDLFNAVVREGTVPADWYKSWMISIYKGKGDAIECGSYRWTNEFMGPVQHPCKRGKTDVK